MTKEKEKPTESTSNIRQKKVAKEVIENGGSVSAAMRKAGYSDAYASNPHKLTNTKSWQELMDEYLPDELLSQKHRELLNKTDEDGQVETHAVKSGLDMGYKLKGKYAPDKVEHEIKSVEIVKYGKEN